MKFISIVIISLLCLAKVYCQPASVPLKMSWRLLGNNYLHQNENQCVFTLSNIGEQVFPASGWSLFFSFNGSIDNARIVGHVRMDHLNGDYYQLKPLEGFQPIKPGESMQITYISDGQLRNYSSAPAGMYLVWDAAPDKGLTLAEYKQETIQDSTLAWVTPEMVFERNRNIRDVPAPSLPKIFPTPAFYQENAGSFTLSGMEELVAPPLFEKEAKFLSDAMMPLFGMKLVAIPQLRTGVAAIVFKEAPMAPEAYHLTVTRERITIEASAPAGAFYAVQSLLSLIPAEARMKVQGSLTLPAVEVRDEPRFGYRSLSFDVARNFRSKAEVKRVLDLMAMYKMNVLHFHLTEDEGWRLEIPGLPELTEIGAKRGHGKNMLPPAYGSGPEAGENSGSGYYTRADFLEILRYATERHIQVIPEIESPGHARAAIKSMDYRYEQWMKQGNKTEAEKYLLRDLNDRSVYSSAQLYNDNVMCVALPSVYTFMEKVTNEIIAMYAEANAPLKTIHMGGDEVPAGAWEKSPLCQELIAREPSLENTNDLWYYYYGKLNDMLQCKYLYMSGWEEMAMRKTKLDGQNTMIPNPGFAGKNMQVHVWNNVLGWGAEDLPYRLANAGFKVILSPVSNNYFDLCYYKHPDEPGLSWGGYQDIDKPFYFVPYNYYKTSKEGPDGKPIDPAILNGKDRLTDYGKSNIVGVEGLIWSETLLSDAALEYMILPKMLAFAERAWAPDPAWATEKDPKRSAELYDAAWSVFVNTVGKREMPRLSLVNGGYNYRIPTPGARVENGKVVLNVQFPGLTIRYTTDGSAPDQNSPIYTGPIAGKGKIRAAAFDIKGRSSRVIEPNNRRTTP